MTKPLPSTFLNQIIAAAQKDNYISETERLLIDKAAKTLGVSNSFSEDDAKGSLEFNVSSGMKICFTGTAVGSDGQELPRETLEALASKAGHTPVSSVTKKTCDLLVAADKSSLSGKAKKARDYGIPVISVSEFLDLI